MKTKHVEDFSIACMDEGSIPSDSTIIPLKLNVHGVLFFWWVARWVVRSFLALKDVTDPSDLTMLWMMQKSLDCFVDRQQKKFGDKMYIALQTGFIL